MPHRRPVRIAEAPRCRFLRPLGALGLVVLLAGVAEAREPHPVHTLLDAVHEEASKAHYIGYFNLFTPHGLFVGTDPGEIWSIDQFREYAQPIFAKGKGWTYHPVPGSRRVRPLSKDGSAYGFYEQLKHEKYGTLHGSGVVVLYEGKLRVDMYVLSFAIPNDKAKAMLKAISPPPPPKID